jgi:lipoprotein-releasing system permease protein
MFELSIALRYLVPRFKQLSVSIISSISILVIALVVWLAVIFLSVTTGIEKNWIEKLVALNGSVQITPTSEYHHSYYHKIDPVSLSSNYQKKSLRSKLYSSQTNPWDPDFDMTLPINFPSMETDSNGDPLDIVKSLTSTITTIDPYATLEPYENSFANLRLRLIRDHQNRYGFSLSANQSFINPQSSSFSIVSSFEGKNPYLDSLIKPPNAKDLSNLLYLLSISGENIQEDNPSPDLSIPYKKLQERLTSFFANCEVKSLKSPNNGYPIEISNLPKNSTFQGLAFISSNKELRSFTIPKDSQSIDKLLKNYDDTFFEKPIKATLTIKEGQYEISSKEVSLTTPSFVAFEIAPDTTFKVSQLPELIGNVMQISEIPFLINDSFQGNLLHGKILYKNLSIADAKIHTKFQSAPKPPPLWAYTIDSEQGNQFILPKDPDIGEGVLLAHSFQDKGTLVGDRGYLSFYLSTSGSLQEQRTPFYVAGFYNTGVLYVGGKMILASPKTANLIHNSNAQEYLPNNEGIAVWVKDIKQVDAFKENLESALKEKNIDKYWHVQTYKEYEFAKGLVQQFQSDKNLFTLIAIIIIIVACSNIISMLILLVNDKKKEIGILMSMGASAKSIAFIFGLCGTVMGIIGSLLGIFAAVLTLKNLQALIDLISYFQGFEAFNSAFYGPSLPNEVNEEALWFILITTSVISLIAGLIPAIKASQLRPSRILREEL